LWAALQEQVDGGSFELGYALGNMIGRVDKTGEPLSARTNSNLCVRSNQICRLSHPRHPH
jgi:hypothetical protein